MMWSLGRSPIRLSQELVADAGPKCEVCGEPATGGLLIGPMLRLDWCDEHIREVCRAMSDAYREATVNVECEEDQA